jgi:citrate lyase subunit beta/citryl-CoA lyase
MTGPARETANAARSFLFVPGGDERKLEKALGSGADVLLIDLEDSVAPGEKAAARQTTGAFLAAHRADTPRPRLYVRVNDLGSGFTRDDLAAVVPVGAEGVMLPKALSGGDIAALAELISAIDGAAAGLPIIAIATETPVALLRMESFIGAHSSLTGLTWGSEDLSTAIGAITAREPSGEFTSPFLLARNLCLFAAHAAGVQAIDSIYADFRDEEGLTREAQAAARDGFTAKMAIHPAQVPAINAAFTPSPEAVAEARAIVDAFAANPQAGAIGLNGRMIDRPHLVKAQRLLARAGMRA